jgi:glycosidase
VDRGSVEPQTDGTGFNNSVLEVAGSVLAPLKAHPLAQTKKGRDQPVEVQAVLKDDELLVAEKSIILINNQLVGGDRVDIDEKTGRITLYPSGEWDATNWLTLVLKASTGRQGHFIFPLDWSDAERSPRDEIIYNTITDRFADGNPDNTKPVKGEEEIHPLANYYGGDWRGIINKIEEGYFTKLGVTTLWISPMNKNPEGALKESVPPFGWYTGYHGYWPISATETHASYGTMDDLKELVATAHKHGIAILLDFVVNHVHEDHALIKENPTWAVPENTPDGRPNIRLFDEFPFTTWFETYLPTLEFNNNPELVKFMTDNAIYWLSETGADGFRLDAVKHVPHSFWVSLNEAMTERFGEQEGRLIYTVGESISSRGTINEFLGPDMLSGQFDFPLYWKIEEVFAKGAGSLAEALEEALKSQQNYLPGSIMSPLVGNHDIIRFMGWADDDIPEGMEQKEIGFKIPPVVNSPVSYRKMQSAFAFLFSLPGAPMVYYGDEIGLTGAHDPDNRRPMIWDDWSDDQQATFDQASALMAARHDSIALRRGYLIPVQASDEMIAFLRVSPEEQVLTVIGRKVEGKTFDISLPESHLNASELHPLHLNDISASLENQKLTITFEADWSFGLLKLK